MTPLAGTGRQFGASALSYKQTVCSRQVHTWKSLLLQGGTWEGAEGAGIRCCAPGISDL